MKTGSGFGAKSDLTEILACKDLSNKGAIVSGGYSGLGLETNCAMVKLRCEVLRTSENDADRLWDVTEINVGLKKS
jgi:hypothetical protein